jgi:proteasome accessory factor C
MSVDATERLQRLLSVFPLFAERSEIPLTELERSSGVDVGTLLDDLAAITERSDEPGGFISSVMASIGHSHVEIRSDHFLRPLRLNVEELCAIELGLALLAATSAPDELPAIARARARVREAIVSMPAEERKADMWRGVSPTLTDGDVVAKVRTALRDRRKLRMKYTKGSASEATERTVRGYGLIPANDTWYLVAHCESSEGTRFFRLDRVEDVVVLDARYRVPAGLSVEKLTVGGKPFYAQNARVLTVRYSPRIARWIAEREHVSLAEDGSLTLEHPLADTDWAVRHVLQYGPDAEVIAPVEVREQIRTRLASLLA